MSCCSPLGGGTPTPPGAAGPWAHLRATNDDNVFPVAGGDETKLIACTGASFELVSSAGDFTLGADGVLTYTGAASIAQALLTAVLTIFPSGGLDAWAAVVVSLNGDMLGDSVLDTAPHAVQQVTNGIAVTATPFATFGEDELRKSHNITSVRRLALATGNTLQVIAANFLADPLAIVGLSLEMKTLSLT